MSTYTTNYHLEKPDAGDPFGDFRQSYNDNMDKIDQNLGGGGGNADVVHLTKAEYDALPDTKLSDNKIYLIEDAPSGGGGSGHTILDPNGTVLTQRSYLQFTGGVTVTDDSANDKTVVNISGGGSSTLAGLSDVDLNNLSDGQIIKYNSTTQKWENANSGGGSSTEYSSTEKVIGKWVDNSTLYERVIEYSCQNNANIQVADAMSNGEQLKNVISPIFIASNGDMIADRWVGMDFWQWVYDHASGIMVQRKTSDGNWQSGVTFRAIIQYTKLSP